MENEQDKLLLEQFRNSEQVLPDEPFVSAAGREIRAIQKRRDTLRRLVPVVCVLVVAAASPWLIDASVAFSGLLESAFRVTESFLESRTGLFVTVGLTLPFLIRYRRSIL